MVVSTQELRRRWTDKSNAVFYPSDRCSTAQEYAATDHEREFDFKGCRNIVFLSGKRTGAESDVLLLAKGSGHMTLPAGVQVLVDSGFVKCEPAYGSSGAGSSVGVGVRAPPPSRAASSYAGSSYSRPGGGGGGVSYVSAGTYRPPQEGSRAGSSSGYSYVSARGVPLPESVAGTGFEDPDWIVEAEAGDDGSVAPGDSISSVGVGSRRPGGSGRSSYSFY
ncbi:hypothetical protein B0H66DRAFT_107443 [Apodospora peruviana]|uniref:Uncharacterized protein n=1 Tax=Apodospora peruviana TaxID=516989 RepID=A0AAE0IHB8_9PEZI|nr:hypothetical protein B0H66DRAFT_107443 [Apodospora peruviana]